MKLHPDTKQWDIQLTVPKSQKQPYHHQRNRSVRVLATSAMRAIALALEQYPDAEVWSVHHSGRYQCVEDECNTRFIIDDGATIQTTP